MHDVARARSRSIQVKIEQNLICGAIWVAAAGGAWAQDTVTAIANELDRCATIDAPQERLACLDALSRRVRATAPATASATAEAAPATAADAPADAIRSALGERWAIGKTTRFDVLPHEPSYLLIGRYSDNPNTRPGTPSRPAGPVALDVQDVEAKFQLSFKVRVAAVATAGTPSLWFGYTQQSQWQLYNKDQSRYFRNTDHAPELMLAFHPQVDVGPFRWRLLNLGFVHQSNGRSEVLSRSWNRFYAQFGLERGNLVVLVRPWVRVKESNMTDDNQDIRETLGHGDVVISHLSGRHVFALKGRQNFSSGRGFVEGSWSFPLGRRLNGYLQASSGYGESLIDYNWRQNTVGLGVSLFDWQ
jgi:phospholipase A1/A2